MTSSVLHSQRRTASTVQDPQFDHAIGSRALVVMAVLMALLLAAFFIYGQIAPGA